MSNMDVSSYLSQESAFYINSTLSTGITLPFRDAYLDRTHLHDLLCRTHKQILPLTYAKIERLPFFNESYQIVSEDHGMELISTTSLTS